MANLTKGVDGRYKLTVFVEYEIKGTSPTEISVNLSAREIKKRVKDIKKLTKVLLRMKKHGFNIENIEVGVDGE